MRQATDIIPAQSNSQSSEWLHGAHAACRYLTVSQALKRIDSEGVLFFLGILMAVASLNAAGLLKVRLTSTGRQCQCAGVLVVMLFS